MTKHYNSIQFNSDITIPIFNLRSQLYVVLEISWMNIQWKFHLIASFWSRSGLAQRVDFSTDWNFSPNSSFRLVWKPVFWMHDQNTVSGQSVQEIILRVPFCGFFLWGRIIHVSSTHRGQSSIEYFTWENNACIGRIVVDSSKLRVIRTLEDRKKFHFCENSTRPTLTQRGQIVSW